MWRLRKLTGAGSGILLFSGASVCFPDVFRRSLAKPCLQLRVNTQGSCLAGALRARNCVAARSAATASRCAETERRVSGTSRLLSSSALPRSLPSAGGGSLRTLGSSGVVIGVDEAGRGTWAGPVVAAAVLLKEGARGLPEGVVDSKRLTERRREMVFEQLTTSEHVQWSVATISRSRIDEINILQATFEAMAKAVTEVGSPADVERVLIDGNRLPPQLDAYRCETVVKGDNIHMEIAAASIVAKVTRDRIMKDLDALYPEYSFGKHKGYGTKAHATALQLHGPSPEHRRSFNPIRRFLQTGEW
eukprot:TRINITY_DN8714_c0_g5_i1.p1 TRINITY_DN8714_c0_g5~~TRINITY_DN8714_c0_g5_i1.p1  ORF type:complete len:304 (-),score=33.14 TRINITY_DN8714_c0_g5_i1:365-1276(-)